MQGPKDSVCFTASLLLLQMDGKEATLARQIQAAQGRVHEALLDNLNTKAALDALLDLVKDTNKYLADRQGNCQGAACQAAMLP